MRSILVLLAGVGLAAVTAGACLAFQGAGAEARRSDMVLASVTHAAADQGAEALEDQARLSEDRQSQWQEWIERRRAQIVRLRPAIGRGIRRDPLPVPAEYRTDIDCMTAAIYFEARSEPGDGQAAVGQVIMNRVASRHYPNTVCEVVFQNNGRFCQFTFACDGSMRRGVRDRQSWDQARRIAERILAGERNPALLSATHYHTTAIYPRWAPSHPEIMTIGAHVFRTGTEGSILG